MADSTLELALKIRAAVDGVDAIRSLGNSFVTTNAQIETLIRGLTAISGSSEGASKEFDYLTEQARRYGISILDLSDNYVKFIAASKGTALEGEAARKIFEATASAMAVLGGETVTTHRAFTALSQMMSKGQIYAEELKGQLAEAIPGALQIMAKGLGITTTEMLNLMKAGQLTSSALLPFAIQLEKQYGSLASSTTTFAQVTNRLQTEWALLMKRMGDTGAWSVVTGAIDLLGKNSEVLAGVVGGALAVSFVKLTQGIASVVTGITTYITATRLGATATQNAAVSALANAEANAQLALSARTSTTNILATATANEIATRGTVLHAVAVKELQLATAQASIANKEYAAATALVDVAQKKVVASTGLFARALSFLTGPAGIITAVIAGFAYMSFAFKEQDEVNKTLEKSTDDYTKSLESMTSAQVIQSNITSSKLINDKKALIDKYKDEISILNNVEDQNSRVGLVYSKNGNFLLSFMKVKDKSIELESELGKLTSDLSILEAKRALGLNALNNKYGELVSSEMSLKESHNELLITQKEQQTEVDRLSGIWFKSREEVIALGLAQDKLRVTNKQVADSNQAITNSSALTRNALSALAESTNLSEEAIRAAFDGNMDYISSLDIQSQAIVVSIRRGIELAKMQSANEAQLKQLNAEYKRIEGSVKAKTEATLKEAESLGDLETKRIAEIQGKRILVDLAELGIKTVNKEIDVINNHISLMKESAIQNEKELSDIEKNIAKEEIKREELLKTKAAREANLVALKAEAIATEVANSLISESFSKNQAIISASSNKIRELQTEYKNLGVTSEAVFNKKQTDILEQIRIEQEKVTEAARTMGVAMRGIFTTLGLDYDEAITGMDFQTKRMIDAFGLLGTGGVATANQIQEAFTNVLGKADTEAELLKLRSELEKLGNEGVISFNSMQLKVAEVDKKLIELKGTIDPIQQAFAKLGIGVPEQLQSIADSFGVAFNVIKDSKPEIESVQSAFVKYAEAQVAASVASGKAVPATLAQEAAALGLSNTYQLLTENARLLNPEFAATAELFDRAATHLEQYQSKVDATLTAESAWLETKYRISEALGNEEQQRLDLIAIAEQEKVIAQQSISAKQADLALMESELAALSKTMAAGKELNAEQRQQLEDLKARIPVIRQEIEASKAKAEQTLIEAEATRLANSIISDEFERQKQIVASATSEIGRLYDEYEKLSAAGENVTILNGILEQIKNKQKEASDGAQGMAAAMKSAFDAVGLNYNEVITGMDFETKRMINAFGLMGTAGFATARDIQTAFTNVLAKANTEVELKAIETQLINLGSQGKISGDQLAQSLAAVNTKASELRAAVDPLQIAMEKLGIGVPEKLAAVANESERFYLTIKNSKAPIDEVQQAFLKYAEDALVAAENGAKIDTAQLKVQASALGLGNAFDDIKKKVSETSAEYNGVLSKYESLIALQQKEIEIAKLLVDVGGERNQSSILLNENLGKELVLVADLIKEDQLKIASTEEEIVGKEKSLALDKEKLIELQGLRDKGEQLSVTQQEQLALLERQIPIDEQSIVISKEKVKQAESLVLSYQNISADIARIVSVSERELNQSNDLLASKKDKIEAEKKLALVMGDTAKAQQLGIESSKIDIEISKNTAQAKRESAITVQEYVAQLTQQALSDGIVTEEEQKAIDVANRLADAKRNEADAARDTAAALEKNSEAANKLADAERSAKEAADQRAAAGKAVNAQWGAANEVLAATGGNVEKLNAAFLRLQEEYARGRSGFMAFATATATAADEVAEAYRGQEATLSKAVATLEHYAETGEWTSEVQRAMALNSRDLDSWFNLLDEQDFDRLRAAMDSANNKLREMQEEARDARQELGDLNAELLEAQGMDEKANLLREQLDYQQRLADITARRAEAEASGNKELLEILNSQAAVLAKIHATKMENIQRENEEEGKALDKTTGKYKELDSVLQSVGNGMRQIATTDLGFVVKQADDLRRTLDETRKLL